jgi:ParB-like nuclease domain
VRENLNVAYIREEHNEELRRKELNMTGFLSQERRIIEPRHIVRLMDNQHWQWPHDEMVVAEDGRTMVNLRALRFRNDNRDTNLSALRKLIASFNQFGYMRQFPIIVNSNNEIIDGQHRFKLAILTGERPSIRVDDDFTIEKAVMANKSVTMWNTDDRLRHRAIRGDENAKAIIALMKMYNASSRVVMMALGMTGSEGTVELDSTRLVEAQDILDELAVFDAVIPNVNVYREYRFIAAYRRVRKVPKFDVKTMHDRAEKYGREMILVGQRIDTTLRTLVDTYNYHTRAESRISMPVNSHPSGK